MTDVFISYSRKDKSFVRRLYEHLETQDYDAWVDWDDIEYAEDWWAKICAGIEAADHFIFVISPDSVRSKVCYDEVEHATQHSKRIIPLIYHDLGSDDHQNMHASISRHNWLPFTAETDFDSAARVLIETINTNPEHVRLHTRLLVRAIEWDDANRPHGQLLRGEPLTAAEHWLTAGVDENPPPASLHAEYIAASQQARQQRARTILGTVSLALIITLGLAILSFVLFQQSEDRLELAQQRGTEVVQESDQRATQQFLAEDRLELAQQRGTEVVQESDQRATQQFLAEVAEATAVRSAMESQALALVANAQQALDAGNTDLALALALEAVSIDDPLEEAQNILVAAAFTPATIDVLAGHQHPISAMDISPDERLLLTGSEPPRTSEATPNEIILWDMETGELLQREELPQFARDAFIEELGEDLFNYMIEESGLELFMERVEAIQFTDNGRVAVVATNLTTLRWDVDNWQLIDFTLHESTSFDGDISPNGKVVFYGDIRADEPTSRLYQLDILTGSQRIVFEVEQQIRQVIVGTATIALGLADGDVLLLERATMTEKARFAGSGISLNGLAFNPSETELITVYNAETNLWNIENGRLIQNIEHPVAGETQPVYSADGTQVAWGLNSGQAIIWDAQTLEVTHRLSGHRRTPSIVHFIKDGSQMITGGADQSLRVWDLQIGEIQRLAVPDNRVRSIIIADETQQVFAGEGDEPETDIIIWDLANNTETGRLTGHTNTIVDLELTRDEAILASGAFDNTVRLWDVESRDLLWMKETDGPVISLEFTEDGRQLATGLAGGVSSYFITLWDVATGEELERIETAGVATGVHFLADNTQLIAAINPPRGAPYIGIFDIETGELLSELVTDTRGNIIDLVLSSDKRYLIATGQDTTFFLWDLQSGQVIQRFVGHSDEIREARFTPDGQLIVSVSLDKTVRLWDIESGAEIASLVGHNDSISTVDVSTDGQTLVTGSADRSIRQWVIPVWSEDLLSQVRSRPYLYTFTCQEREQYRLEPPCED